MNFQICPTKRFQFSLHHVAAFGIVAAMLIGARSAIAARAYGIDVSGYQSASINWNTLKNTYGITFGWAKASEGGSSAGGGNWPTYVVNAKAAGVYIGPYHYARYDLNPGKSGATNEANYFWNRVKADVKADGLSLMPMLDVEASFTGQTKTTISEWVNAWCLTVSNNAAAVGLRVKPCVYISSSKAATYLNSSVTVWNTDIANWPYAHNTALASAQSASAPPAGISPWTTWQFWQYDDRSAAYEYTTGDGDIFNGTLAQLTNTMLVTPIGPNITSQPASITVSNGATANFFVSATGNGTLHYQWKFNGANISGATTSHLTINNVQLGNAGGFSVLVSDNNGSTLSSPAFLSVIAPLTNMPGAIVAPSGLVDWWPAEGNLIDLIGGKNGTPKEGFSYAVGKQGRAFHFDGNASYFTTTGSSIPVPWTACFWVNRQNAPGTGAALAGDGSVELKLEQYNGTRQVGFTRFGVGDYNFGYTVPQNTWTHLAFVASGTQMRLYVNGSLTSTITTNIPCPRAYFGVGYASSSGKFVDYLLGSVDEILMFNRALNVSEINAIYTAGSAGLVRAPEFIATASPGPGQFELDLRGITGKSFSIYRSEDLLQWAWLTTIPNPSGSVQFIDNTATNSQNFYRITQP